MSAPPYDEKDSNMGVVDPEKYPPESGIVANQPNQLARELQGRHMQMIAIGGAIGAGLFVGTGNSLAKGGPGSLTLGYIIVGTMLLFTMQAVGEMAVLYPVNGAFYQYICRFLDPALGFALGWDYAIGWLIILPFEITAAGITISYWHTYNIGIWIAVFLSILVLVQVFGVRGYGEVEFILSIIKIIALTGFIIFGIIDACGGVPTDPRGYIGAHYWHDPGAFHNGFHGFCTVFVTTAFAFGGTELTALAAAESADPAKSLPTAIKQVFWRIAFFYILGTFIVGLLVPSDSDVLLGSSGANTKASPFVYAFVLAGVKGLPSVMNAVITISVISVANSATFGSTRTFQALASQGMAPKVLAYVDKKGRPLPSIILQLIFGLLAFINEAKVGTTVFNWLLALSGLSYFFIWGSICAAHIRFRYAMKEQGFDVKRLRYKAPLGVYGSYVGLLLNFLSLCATFYTSLFPVGESASAEAFFTNMLALPIVILLYLGWKIYSASSKNERINQRGWRMYIRAREIDLTTGMRDGMYEEDDIPEKHKKSLGQRLLSYPKDIIRALF